MIRKEIDNAKRVTDYTFLMDLHMSCQNYIANSIFSTVVMADISGDKNRNSCEKVPDGSQIR